LTSSEDFDAWFSTKDTSEPDAVVKQLHKVLRPFLLRRVKADVEHSLLPKKEINLYVGMTEMQRKWYRMLLEKDIDAVNGESDYYCHDKLKRRRYWKEGRQDEVAEHRYAVAKVL
jgi:SNF2 family DNA or RNA helicase